MMDAVRRNPSFIAALAYAGYALLGALLLAAPFMREAARHEPVSFVDALFISVSAVSTTGLVTLDPGTTFNFAGELTILVLFQIGGLGYMTFMSFAYVVLRDRMGTVQSELTRSSFGLPDSFDIRRFVWRITIASLLIEAAGAAVLAVQFEHAGIANPVWSGIFHSVSAYCTAGFSLFPTSFETFRGNGPVLLTIAALSYLGALGFVVLHESIEILFIRPGRLSATTRIILWMTFWLTLGGTVGVWLVEPAIHELPTGEQLQNAFFQAMTASTTVGFNSLPIGGLSPAAIVILYLLMLVGASPAGTGGGLKSTTAAALFATARASLRGRKDVVLQGVRIPEQRVRQAAGTLVLALCVVFVSLLLLDVTGRYAFDRALFEVLSALSTVGLSMGLTGELNTAGKLIITLIMYIGRVGILAFFVVFVSIGAEEDRQVLRERDVIL